MLSIFILLHCLALQTFCKESKIETENIYETEKETVTEDSDTKIVFPDNEEITAALKNPNKSLEKTTRGKAFSTS